MRKFLFVVLFIGTIAPAVADPECPIGYSPAEYTQLEYIESTGTQFIDTGHKKYTAGHNYRIVSSVWFANVTTRQVQGCQGYFYFGVIDGYWQFAQAETGHVAQRPNTRTWYDIDALFDTTNNLCNYSINEESFTLDLPVPYATSKDGSTFAVFSLNEHIWPFGNARVKNYALYDNNALVRNFIPAKRNSDNEIGMFDTVSGQFFTNAGSGFFIAGPQQPTEFMNTNICAPCPPNTYKDFIGNEPCTPCPNALISPSGSTNVNECMRILHIGDKIYPLNSTKKTSPALHIRDENGKIWYGNLYSSE